VIGRSGGRPAPAQRDGETSGFPWQLGLGAGAWVVLGGLLVVGALTTPATSDGADQASVDKIRDNLGDSAVAARASAHPTLLLLIGAVVLLMAVLLLLGQGWARYVLPVLGIVSLILLGVDGRGEAVHVFAALVVGTVPLLSPTVHRYLAGR
jgi:hypothetical protein